MTVEVNPQPEVKMDFGEVIGKLGLSYSFLLCREKLTSQQIDSLEYEDWQKIYFSTRGYFESREEEKNTEQLALQKMLEKADKFSQVRTIYMLADKDSLTFHQAEEKLLEMGKIEDWLEVLKSDSCGCSSKNLKKIASDIIRRAIQ